MQELKRVPNLLEGEPPIYVTQPDLPPLEQFIPYLEKIWANRVLTNCGPFHQQLEAELANFLGVKYVSLFTNGTLALLTALQAVGVEGEAITTPFSFVATAHSMLWNRIKPVFVDIDPYTLNIDPAKIEESISADTTAIVPVHCYGRPCDVHAIDTIARNNKLTVIYDAAHAFGVKDSGGSILRYGDLSVLSFHATKVFNTFEGGAVICSDQKVKRHIDELKNFGFVDEVSIVSPGINGKMSEFNAALGLLQLRNAESAIRLRKDIDTQYRELLRDVQGIRCLVNSDCHILNYSYFPILVEDNYPLQRDALYERLRKQRIFARRYFYPLISQMPMYQSLPSADPKNLPVANSVASKILCLPIYPSLEKHRQEEIVDIIASA